VPINTLSYAFVPKEKTNSASGLINLARNIGGSIGIAAMTTLLARREQLHRAYIVSHVTPYDPTYRRSLESASTLLTSHGQGALRAAAQARGVLEAQIERQAGMLAFAD